MEIFETKSGVVLELRNGGLYTTNLEEVEKALQEDLESDDPEANFCANAICIMMQELGVITEA